MDSAIVIAIVSLLGTIVTGIVQFRKDKAEIKRVEIEAEKEEINTVESIADLMLKMYKEELNSLREICTDLRERIKYLQDQLTQKTKEADDKDKKIHELEDQLLLCLRAKALFDKSTDSKD